MTLEEEVKTESELIMYLTFLFVMIASFIFGLWIATVHPDSCALCGVWLK